MATNILTYDEAEGLKLSDTIVQLSRDDLYQVAKSMGIKGISNAKKETLAQKIADEMLTAESMKHVFATYTKEQRLVFDKIIQGGTLDGTEDRLAEKMSEDGYLVHYQDGSYEIPGDVVDAYRHMNSKEFRAYADQVSWLLQCMYFAERLYGIFDMNILTEMFNSREEYEKSVDQVRAIVESYPEGMTNCHVYEDGMVLALDLAANGKYERLLAQQEGKPFYIPTADEILEFAKRMYASTYQPSERKREHRGHTEMELAKKKVYPNDPCPCGSGKKYKKCHGRK